MLIIDNNKINILFSSDDKNKNNNNMDEDKEDSKNCYIEDENLLEANNIKKKIQIF